MSGIVCAIRGGASSQPTINQAIRTAQEANLPIYFLYVLNLDFLNKGSQSRTHTISEEMQELGEFILLAAQSQAERQGVSAQGIIREGDVVADEIIALCREVTANYVILGRPKGAKEQNVFTHEQLDRFGLHIEQETGATVVYPEGNSA
ncbi:MAG: universal stress protein [Ardenticatenaceae bacterium]|nr:universal stress protein [Ardenticatenaceae bacterium]MCB9443571.1 universal stress protein [Ardenticatenaceae bacterium]